MKHLLLKAAGFLLCATPALMAQQVVYDGGAPNGANAYFLSNLVQQQFTLGSGATVNGLDLFYWALTTRGMYTGSLSYSLQTDDAGAPGTVLESGSLSLGNQTLSPAQPDPIWNNTYTAFEGSAGLTPITLGAGTYWLALTGGQVNDALWSHTDSQTGTLTIAGFGVQPADAAFSLLGAPVTTTPEPASLTLLATGIVGLGGVVRRRRKARPATGAMPSMAGNEGR